MWDIRENNELAKTVQALFNDAFDFDIEVAGEYLAIWRLCIA